MREQLDLFAVAAPKPWDPNGPEEHAGWERCLLADMAKAPVIACYPGFTGAVCERLVAKGLAVCEPAGFLGPPKPVEDMTPKERRWWKAQKPHPRFRYALPSPSLEPQ